MTRDQLPHEQVSKIDYVNVQQYVESLGWTPVPTNRPYLSIYKLEDSPRTEVQIPEDKEFADYGLRMAEVILMLSKVAGQSPSDILTALSIPKSDIFKVSLRSSSTASGTVYINEAINFYDGMEKALLSTGSAVIKPEKFYSHYFRNAKKFAASCRVGQSERGSYVTTIICPLEMEMDREAGLEQAVEQADDTYPRQVTKLFVSFSRNLVRAVEQNATGRILDANSVQNKLSANFCNAIAQMEPKETEASVFITPHWNRAFPVTQDHWVSPIEIKKEYFSSIKQLANQLRPAADPVVAQFVGRVVALEGESDEDNNMHGNISFRFQQGDSSMLAKIFLTPRDYAVACNAHRDSTDVVVTAELKRDPKRRIQKLENYVRFKLITDSDE